ncbi:MAG: NAD(P)-dependent oxidoreductase [Lachnospiraceae bacterium]|nr:NAD(P)-dependent oxidoreductase [Lachnospiraceae bacterium]
MKGAIVTGPTGAVGRALIECLTENGIEVLAVTRKDTKRLSNIPESPLVKTVGIDLSGIKELPDIVRDLPGKYDAFYHLAWADTFGEDARNDVRSQLLNVGYSVDALEAASKIGASVFIGAGSQAEYGRYEGALSGSTPAFPENGYGIAKLAAGEFTRLRASQLSIKHIWVRILSVFGPCDGKGTMIMSAIRSLLDKERPSLTKGEQLWDYLYSKDAGRALFLLGEKGKDKKIYCLGSGKERPLREYMEELRDAIDPSLPLGIGEREYSKNQVMKLVADISALTEDTGFVPDYSFSEGIKETIDWVRKERS